MLFLPYENTLGSIRNTACHESKMTVPIKWTGFLYLYRIGNIYQSREILEEK